MLSQANAQLDALMYHSISDGEGPTCIDESTFCVQLDVLAELGYRSVTLEQVAGWLQRRMSLPARAVLITFDDGFRDFAEVAWPQLRARGFGAVVFLPTGCVGGCDNWEAGAGHTARPIMSWDEVRQLGGEGVEFGGHSVHHEDLTHLSESQMRIEVETSHQVLQDKLDRPVMAFAPPFGRSNRAVRAAIGQIYQLSFGTVLGHVTTDSHPLDLPRIEMHYFRNPIRWRTHLSGGGRWWLAMRRSLRAVRAASSKAFERRVRVSSAQ